MTAHRGPEVFDGPVVPEAAVSSRADGLCPACGFFNQPDADAQVGQDAGTVYCVSCGHVWPKERA